MQCKLSYPTLSELQSHSKRHLSTSTVALNSQKAQAHFGQLQVLVFFKLSSQESSLCYLQSSCKSSQALWAVSNWLFVGKCPVDHAAMQATPERCPVDHQAMQAATAGEQGGQAAVCPFGFGSVDAQGNSSNKTSLHCSKQAPCRIICPHEPHYRLARQPTWAFLAFLLTPLISLFCTRQGLVITMMAPVKESEFCWSIYKRQELHYSYCGLVARGEVHLSGPLRP